MKECATTMSYMIAARHAHTLRHVAHLHQNPLLPDPRWVHLSMEEQQVLLATIHWNQMKPLTRAAAGGVD